MQAAFDVQALLQRHGQWRFSGNEAIGVCPSCRSGNGREKSFSVNLTTAQWCCNRKNNCGIAGGWLKLLDLFGEKPPEDPFAMKPKVKPPSRPPRKSGQLGDAGKAFLASRGISDLTAAVFGVGQDRLGELGECVTWPIYDPAGKLVNVKYRAIERKDFRNTPGALKLPAGLQAIRQPGGRLILVEGELDMLAGHQLGLRHIISVPNGTADNDWLDPLWDWLGQFQEIVLALDADTAGGEAIRKLVKRLGAARCSGVTLPGGHKDLNDCLMAGVTSAEIQAAFAKTHEFKPADIRFIADYEAELLAEKRQPANRYGSMSGWLPLDSVMRGFRRGELSVWSGYSGSGKTTAMGWLVNQFASMAEMTCVASLEMRPKAYLKWIAMQAAGMDWEQMTPAEISAWVSWVSPHFCLLNHEGGMSHERLIEIFTYAANRYGCRMFIADNLMKLNVGGDRLEYQRRAVAALKDFAMQQDAHVHLVAHPRKASASGAKMTPDDIEGASDIRNLADNILIVHRMRVDGIDANFLQLAKNREHGTEMEAQLHINATSKGVRMGESRKDFRDLIIANLNDDDIPDWQDETA